MHQPYMAVALTTTSRHSEIALKKKKNENSQAKKNPQHSVISQII